MGPRLRPPVLVLLLALGVTASGAGRPACELLTVEEVGRVAGGAVTIDPSGSGEDPEGGDNCVWKRGGSVVVETRVQRLASVQQAQLAFAKTSSMAFGIRPAPVKVGGLGDEALYRDFERAKGGALVVRRGAVVFGMSGSLPRDAYLSLARLVLPRL
jgi:hypothetical protein